MLASSDIHYIYTRVHQMHMFCITMCIPYQHMHRYRVVCGCVQIPLALLHNYTYHHLSAVFSVHISITTHIELVFLSKCVYRVLFSGGAEGKLLPQTLFLPPQNKNHLATPFPILKARAPPKIMRARRGLLIQRMRESEPTPFSETFTSG